METVAIDEEDVFKNNPVQLIIRQMNPLEEQYKSTRGLPTSSTHNTNCS